MATLFDELEREWSRMARIRGWATGSARRGVQAVRTTAARRSLDREGRRLVSTTAES